MVLPLYNDSSKVGTRRLVGKRDYPPFTPRGDSVSTAEKLKRHAIVSRAHSLGTSYAYAYARVKGLWRRTNSGCIHNKYEKHCRCS